MEIADTILRCFDWFAAAHDRRAVNCLEVAKYMDEQRAFGRFPNNQVVNALYALAAAENSTAP